MADPQKVTLGIEPWRDDLRPILARLYDGREARMQAVIDAVKREHALMYVARRDGAVQGVLIVAIENLLHRAVYVVAMVALPKTGFQWGPAVWPSLAAHWREKGAELVRCEASTEPNRRRLRRVGFREASTLMVAPLC